MHRSIAHLLRRTGRRAPRAQLHRRAHAAAEGGKTGDWRFITYGEANARATAIAQALLDRAA